MVPNPGRIDHGVELAEELERETGDVIATFGRAARDHTPHPGLSGAAQGVGPRGARSRRLGG